MSRIRRLSIAGIRNFGDNNENSNVHFLRPLTLILGPNGTGKTTIIESLKFATSGEFPPGSMKGKAFIHDTVLSTTRLVQGVVKLEIVDFKGTIYTICRIIECTHTGATSKFKTLDSTLSKRDKGASKAVSITNRCIDINTEISSIMGVSKAILNYVIFCHQEDFSWPLEDGKTLKEKFDEIFDSITFNKALEHLMKYYRNLEQDLRVLQSEKKSFYNTVCEVESKEEKLKDNKERLENTKKNITEIEMEIKPLTQQIQKIEQTDVHYKSLVAEKDKKQLECNVTEQQIIKLKENIQNIFQGTMSELITSIESHDDILFKNSVEIQEFETELQDIAKKEKEVTNLLAEKRVTVGTLKQRINDHKQRIIFRNKTLNEALSAWNLNEAKSDPSDTESITLTKRLENKLEDLKKQTETNRLEGRRKEEKLQHTVDEFRAELSKVESELKLRDTEVRETKKDICKTQAQITQINAAANTLHTIELKLKIANDQISELEKSSNIDGIKEEIQNAIKSRDVNETALNLVDEEIASLHKQSALEAEMQLHKSALTTKQDEVKKLQNKHENNLKILLEIEDLPHVKLKNKLDTVQEKLVNQVKEITQEIQFEQHKYASLEATLKHNEDEYRKKNSELKADKIKISSICNYKDFNEVLLLQSKKVRDLQDKRGMYAYQSTAYKEYLKQLTEKDPCCPLCRRGFDESSKVENLIKRMKNEIENHPHTLEQCELELKFQQNKYDSMLQLKPVVEKVIQMEEMELKNLEENLENTKENLMQLQEIIQKKEDLKVIPENKLMNCKEIFSEVTIWDRNLDEIKKLNEVIGSLQKRMADAGVKNMRSISEAQAEKESLKTSLKNLRNDIENLQSLVNAYTEKLQHAREERNLLFEEQLKIQSHMQQLKQLQDKQKELYTRQTTLAEMVQNLRNKMSIEDNKLKIAIRQLEETKKHNWKKEEDERKLVTEGIRRLSELNKIQNEINAFVQSNVTDSLTQSEFEIKNCEEKMKQYTLKRSNLEKNITKSKDEITCYELRKRELTDNLTLRKIQVTVKDLRQQYKDLQEKIEIINHKEMMEKSQELQTKECILRQKIHTEKGKQEELERAILQYNAELKQEMYRLARKKYMNKCIEITVKHEVVSNLKRYSQIFDSAMLQFHEERMKTVNRVIKRLWKYVYQGNDTTSIEIRTEATTGIGSLRRSYNYKLIQIKHGKEMEMRGRCSAGQKVLASIIIRLALAETFCKSCGILALDEPTTNLDEENANNLAHALNMVIKARTERQTYFQLIVISHDEKFLLKLAQSNNLNGYYELYRKENGLSSIKFSTIKTGPFEAVHLNENTNSSDEEQEMQNTTGNTSDVNHKRSSSFNITDKNDDYNRPAKKKFICNL